MRCAILALLLLFLIQPAHAELSATPLGSPHHGWVILQVRYGAPGAGGPGGGEVGVQDARGGPAMVRPTESASGSLLIPMPVVAPAELGGTWPVDLWWCSSSSGEQEQVRVQVALPAESPGEVVILPGPLGEPGVDWPARLTPTGDPPRTLLQVRLPAEELLHGPPLLAAGVDAVVADASLQSALTAARQNALFNLGVRLVYLREAAPTGQLVWDRVGPAWQTPAVPPGAPQIIQPAVTQMSVPAVGAPGGVRAALLLTGPAAIFLALVAGALFRRRGRVLGAILILFAGLGAGVVMYLRHAGGPENVPLARWEEAAATTRPGGTGAVFQSRGLVLGQARLGGAWSLAGDEGELILPLAASPRGYWALRPLRLVLEGSAMRFEGVLPARGQVLVQRSSVRVAGLLPAFPAASAGSAERARFASAVAPGAARNWWIADGNAEAAGGGGQSLSRWIAGMPGEDARTLRAWYDLRFSGSHRYFAWSDGGGWHLLDAAP